MGTAQDLASRILDLLGQGGPFIYILLALSILAVTIILAKFWQFRSRRVGRRRFVASVLQTWQEQDRADALNQVAAERGPVAVVMLAAMQARTRASMDAETIEVEVQRIARDELGALDTGLRGLELIALLAPLTGLLGTVADIMGLTSGDVPLESALLTTIAGLAISIMAVVFYYIFDGRVERERRAIEAAVEAVLATGGTLGVDAEDKPPPRLEESKSDADESVVIDDDEEESFFEPELR